MNQQAQSQIIKRSVLLAGHRTSVTLEAAFWDALAQCAARDCVSINKLITQVDASRTGNLASALRLYVFGRNAKGTSYKMTDEERVAHKKVVAQVIKTGELPSEDESGLTPMEYGVMIEAVRLNETAQKFIIPISDGIAAASIANEFVGSGKPPSVDLSGFNAVRPESDILIEPDTKDFLDSLIKEDARFRRPDNKKPKGSEKFDPKND